MHPIARRTLLAQYGLWAATTALVAGCSDSDDPPREKYRVLMITQPTDQSGKHPSSDTAAEVFPTIARDNGFGVDVTTDPAIFTTKDLKAYKAIVFVNRTGNSITDPAQRAEFEAYIRGGGGFVGIHATTTGNATNATAWPFFQGLLGGALFFGHTPANAWGPEFVSAPPDTRGVQRIWRGPYEAAPAEAEPGTVAGYTQVNWETAYFIVQQPQSAAMAGMGGSHFRAEEWYGIEPNPRPFARILATVDEGTYYPAGGTMGADHPIAWCLNYQGGRAAYTSLGHRMETWRNDKAFRAHVVGLIAMAAGDAPFDCVPQ